MTILKLIEELQKLHKKHGDLPVRCQTLSHLFAPEPESRPFGKTPQFILLNP